jgi:hypothetical protein
MKIQITPATFENKDCIPVRIEGFDVRFPSTMRQVAGARRVTEQKAWLILYNKKAYAELKRLFEKHIAVINAIACMQQINYLVAIASIPHK